MKAHKKLTLAASLLLVLGAVGTAIAIDYGVYTPIDDVDITYPVTRQIVFAGCDYTVTCTTSTDEDCHLEGGDIIIDDDPVTHTWSGGSFDPITGTSVTWTVPTATGRTTIYVTADDSPLANDTAQGDSVSVIVSDIIYVDEDATAGNDDGTTWANAFLDLQDALDAADSDCLEIWVAEGTYKPGTSRSDYYDLVEGVELYGGFDPTTGDDEWAERDWVNNQTILSGDITGSDCYKIIRAWDVNATVDGLVITKAQGVEGHAAMVIIDGTVDVNHCVFKDNYCNYVGSGGIFVTGGTGQANVNISNSMFINCDTDWMGGALFTLGSGDVDLTNCVFTECDADYGGAVNLTGSADLTLTNCTFTKNSASLYGGAIYNAGTLDVRNSILWGDTAGSSGEIHSTLSSSTTVTYSDIQGGHSGTGNINSDPDFVDDTDPDGTDNKLMTPDDGLSIESTSPCIDAGNNSYISEPYDIAGTTRKLDGDGNQTVTVDMGAYEYEPS
jgi:predicted outer membrane repeat protein